MIYDISNKMSSSTSNLCFYFFTCFGEKTTQSPTPIIKNFFFFKHQTQSTSHVFYFTCKGPHMLLVAFHDT